jgi:hypothetical protein
MTFTSLRHTLLGPMLLWSLAACSATPAVTVQDGAKTVQALVRASTGGTLNLPDGAKLEIPAGALPQDTIITLAMPAYQTRQSEDLYFEITPSLELNAPARLTIPTRDLIPDQTPLTIEQSSVFQRTEDHGPEQTTFQASKIVATDTAADTITLETTHFTGFAILNWVDDPAYMVVDIPDAYLKPGDIGIMLSAEHLVGNSVDTPNWFPGHVAMFTGTLPQTDPFVGPHNMIESGGALVSTNDFDEIRTGYGGKNIYLGPRTLPKNLNLSNTDRQAVVDFAKAQLGKPYNLVGDGGHFLASLISGVTFNKYNLFKEGGFSCVGLVDAAYKSINKSPIKWFDRTVLAVTPQDMYKATVPVSEITVKAGDALEIPVYGVIIAPETKSVLGVTLQGHYMRNRSRTAGLVTSSYAIAPQGLPQGATWTENLNGYVLRWTAQPSAQPVVVKFTMTPNVNTTRASDGKPDDQPSAPVVQELTINVVP